MTKEEQVKEVVRLRDEESLPYSAIANRLEFSESTAKRRYKAYMEIKEVFEDTTLSDLGEPDFSVSVDSDYIPEDKEPLTRFDPMVVYGDAVITGDFHIPLHDPALINDMIITAKSTSNTKNLIIAGDYWNMDSMSSFLPHQPEAAFDIERHDGNVIMKTLLRTFEKVSMTWGNHDFRLAKATGFKHSFAECMEWVFGGLTEEERSRIEISDLDYLYYAPGGEYDRTFRICHPRNFSSIPLTVSRQLSPKYQMSIITFHSHHLAMGVAPNGYDLVMDGGGFFDKTRTEYIQKTSKHHEWVQGFSMFQNGVPTLYSKLFGNL